MIHRHVGWSLGNLKFRKIIGLLGQTENHIILHRTYCQEIKLYGAIFSDFSTDLRELMDMSEFTNLWYKDPTTSLASLSETAQECQTVSESPSTQQGKFEQSNMFTKQKVFLTLRRKNKRFVHLFITRKNIWFSS